VFLTFSVLLLLDEVVVVRWFVISVGCRLLDVKRLSIQDCQLDCKSYFLLQGLDG